MTRMSSATGVPVEPEVTSGLAPGAVAPGFEVASPDGLVRMRRSTRKNFQVLDAFRFTEAEVLADIRTVPPTSDVGDRR